MVLAGKEAKQVQWTNVYEDALVRPLGSGYGVGGCWLPPQKVPRGLGPLRDLLRMSQQWTQSLYLSPTLFELGCPAGHRLIHPPLPSGAGVGGDRDPPCFQSDTRWPGGKEGELCPMEGGGACPSGTDKPANCTGQWLVRP